MSSASSELKAKYEKILRANGIKDEVANVTITKPDLRGMHMASVIDTATIEFASGRDPLHLFLKKKLQQDSAALDEDLFGRVMVIEGTFLTDFVQEMKEFCKQHTGGPDVRDLFPRVYYNDDEVIIQEDLTKRGFTIMPKDVKRTFDETKLVFEHLARLNAVTHVMIAKAGGPEEFLKSHPYLSEPMKRPAMRDMMGQTFEPSFNYCISIMKYSTREDKQEKYELLEKYRGKIMDSFVETIDAETLIYAVGHGDCWNNNMMLDTGETNKKLILVDLQCPRINSPNMDLARFLFASSAPDVRKRWRELFEYYFNVLREYVLALEHPFPFEFEDFVKDMSRKGKMDFLIAILMSLGLDAIENHDTEDASKEDFGEQFTRLLVTYAKNNPDKVSMAGDRMIELMDDYLQFAQL